MEADINALVILITIAFTVFWFFKFYEKPDLFLTTLAINTISVFFLCLTFYESTSLYNRMGRPFLQWFIPLMCLWLVISFTRIARFTFCILFIIMAFSLSYHYNTLLCNESYSGENYIGYTRLPENIDKDFKLSKLKKLLLSKAGDLNVEEKENWLDQIELKKCLSPNEENLLNYTYLEVDKQWHSAFSNLYKLRRTSYKVWYSGGILKNNIDKIYYKKN